MKLKPGLWLLGLVLGGGVHALFGFTRPSQSLVLHSAAVLVKDQTTGELLFQKDAEEALPIASITKLVTAMVVLDAHLDQSEVITVEEGDKDQLRHSRSHLPVGTRLTRGQALLVALMASENRAANALGRTYPGGLGAFVPAMNAKAKNLGLSESRFEDPAGLSSGNVASARDLAKLVEAAYGYQEIRSFTTRDDAPIVSGRRTIVFHNTNRLVRNPNWQIGLSKTGFIDEAGRCLVMQAQVARRPVVMVLLDSQGKLTRFGDATRIKDWMEGGTPVVRGHRCQARSQSRRQVRTQGRTLVRKGRRRSRRG